ncbi:MAG: hypothetical protein ACD_10C00213G0002 [uncultured bacterium]|nr:MAG: hypothetical protein ACD_10C00213G0002 [uncultured bacterium]
MRCITGEIQHKRINFAAGITQAQADVAFCVIGPRHRELEVEADFPAIGGFDRAARGEAGLFGFGVRLAEVVFDAIAC